MIRDVVVHIANEQPLLADLFDLPDAGDAGLVCTNLRSMDGKRPVFIDRIENTFFFPYRAIRFLELPAGALERHAADGGRAAPVMRWPASDEGSRHPAPILPAVIEPDAGDDELDLAAEPGGDIEIDEAFLRRIRDI